MRGRDEKYILNFNWKLWMEYACKCQNNIVTCVSDYRRGLDCQLDLLTAYSS
jgi:hypothetical protein